MVGKFLNRISEWFKFEPHRVYAISVELINDSEHLDINDVKQVSIADYLKDMATNAYICPEKVASRLFIVVNETRLGLKKKPSNPDKLISMVPVAPADAKEPLKRNINDSVRAKPKKLAMRMSPPSDQEGSTRQVLSPTKAKAFMTPPSRPFMSPTKRTCNTVTKVKKDPKTDKAFTFNEYDYSYLNIYRKLETGGLSRRQEAKGREARAELVADRGGQRQEGQQPPAQHVPGAEEQQEQRQRGPDAERRQGSQAAEPRRRPNPQNQAQLSEREAVAPW